ncbi:MAG: hypothetical protein C0601_01575 [Candidatus Muiribacterium halophilum]|uniref:Glycosyltransferase 2-like domain-containing protein n=1 Tax=Muiribacterium halophilum TaxID=2053465 RepID=A0A2N5ZLR3_MUIH1|nr:MAG: hypothetical protein C0601_01575 [Candidatus Muirbacterium halophilum]
MFLINWIFYTSFFYVIVFPFLFPLNLVYLFFKNKSYNSHKKNTIDRITILIPVYNEAKTIIDTLLHVKDIDFNGNLTIYLIDDNSTDNTRDRITDFIESNPDLSISLFSNNKRIGKAGIMNRFIPEIKDEIVLVLDANIRLAKDSLINMTSYFKKNTGILFGNLILQKNHYSSITEEEIWYWNLETFLKRIQNSIGNITSPVGGFYLLRKSLFEKIPSECLTEDMYLLLKILSKNYSSKFCYKAKGYEFTEKSTVSEFKRKKRIMKGGFYILGKFIHDKYSFKLKKVDMTNLILNKFMRWIYPILFFVSIIAALFDFKRNKISRTYLLLNFILFLLTAIEFIINTFLNTLLEEKRIRVRFFKKPLYFYTLMTSGIMALKKEHKGQRWEKDER